MKDTSRPKPQCTIVFYGPNGPLELVSRPSIECFIGGGGLALIAWLNGENPCLKDYTLISKQLTMGLYVDVLQLFEHQ